MQRSPALLATVVTAAALGACGGGGGTPTPTATPVATANLANRPSSPAKLTIVSPTNGQVVHGTRVHIVVSLTGAQIVPATSTNISPTQGHIHLLLDGNVTFMNYGYTEDLPVTPGSTYTLGAEFVASDHFPFNPRVMAPQVVFTVAP